MRWITHYQLFLFDLDGLLVNTEELHYQAYKTMLQARGYELSWDFITYFRIAQQDAEAPRRHIYKDFPLLFKEEPNWDVLYKEKKAAYLTLLKSEPAPVLPGVKELLEELQEQDVTRCVVTHSAKIFVDALQEKNPILQTIPHWITREDYERPKPAPDGYLKACELFAKAGDSIIGFEDSYRGMQALRATRATPILINGIDPSLRDKLGAEGIRTFNSFTDLFALSQLP